MNRLLVPSLVALAMLALGCGGPIKGYCEKAKECCGSYQGLCDSTSKDGWVDRCENDQSDRINDWKTWKQSSCDAVASAANDYASCLGGISCTDISNTGEIAKCNDKATALCNAMKTAGDACGGGFPTTCDNFKASLLN